MFILPGAKSWALPSISSLSSGLIYTTVWKDWDGESTGTTHTLRKEGPVCLGTFPGAKASSTQHEEQGDLQTAWNSVSRVGEAGKRAARSGLPLSWPLASAAAPSACSCTRKIRRRAQLDCHESCVDWYKRALCPEDDGEAPKNLKSSATLFARALKHFFMQQISRCFCTECCVHYKDKNHIAPTLDR